jgi:hypothetical protein
MRKLPVACALLLLAACSETSTPTAAAPAADTESPKESPLKYKVLADEGDKAANTVDYHVLVADGVKHDDVDQLLKFLYRHLMTRREPAPSGISGSVYSNEAQYRTPPRSPIATVVQKPGDVGPTFDNKVPLEFWQQVDQALSHTDKGYKLEKKITRDDVKKTLTLMQPYTEPGKDAWAEQLSFNMAMNVFTDTTQALFEKVPELHAFTFIGRWKDKEVVNITLDRSQEQALKLNDIDEQIGQLHGRAFLELSSGRSSDAKASKENSQRMAQVYRKLLTQLPKSQVTISSQLK